MSTDLENNSENEKLTNHTPSTNNLTNEKMNRQDIKNKRTNRLVYNIIN